MEYKQIIKEGVNTKIPILLFICGSKEKENLVNVKARELSVSHLQDRKKSRLTKSEELNLHKFKDYENSMIKPYTTPISMINTYFGFPIITINKALSILSDGTDSKGQRREDIPHPDNVLKKENPSGRFSYYSIRSGSAVFEKIFGLMDNNGLQEEFIETPYFKEYYISNFSKYLEENFGRRIYAERELEIFQKPLLNSPQALRLFINGKLKTDIPKNIDPILKKSIVFLRQLIKQYKIQAQIKNEDIFLSILIASLSDMQEGKLRNYDSKKYTDLLGLRV